MTASADPSRRPPRWWLIVVANLVPVAASLGFAVVALIAPSALLPPGEPDASEGAAYYAGFYVVRAVPIGIALIIALLRLDPGLRTTELVVALLGIAAIAQVGDAIVGGVHGTTALIGGAIAATIHVASLAALLTWQRGARAR